MASPLLLVLLLGSAMLCGTAQGQAAPRFSRLSSCLGTLGSSSRCVTCRTQVTVDAEEGADCSRTDRSLEGRTCSRLEDVIESIAMRETEGGGGGCVGVLVQPRPLGMAHVVLARENRVLTQNIVIRGTDQVGTQSGGCMGVLVQPWPLGMAHVVLARENRVLTQNIVIRGTDPRWVHSWVAGVWSLP